MHEYLPILSSTAKIIDARLWNDTIDQKELRNWIKEND